MEDLCERIPLISDQIFKNLTNRTLINCRKASRRLNQLLDQDKNNWIRIILKYKSNFKDFKESWNKVLFKTPTGIIKKLSLAVHELFSSNAQLVSKNMLIYYKPVSIGWLTPKDPIYGPNQWSPLHIAAACGDLELCNYIVQKTEDINPKDFISFTPLHLAAHGGHLRICQLIANSLVDKNPPDEFGITPLHIFASSENLELFQFFLDSAKDKNPKTHTLGITPLHIAARNGNTEICKMILNTIQDKNPRDQTGKTPLHEAYEYGRLEICKLLIDSDTDLVMTDDYSNAIMESLRKQCEPSMTFWAIYSVLSFSLIYTALCHKR